MLPFVHFLYVMARGRIMGHPRLAKTAVPIMNPLFGLVIDSTKSLKSKLWTSSRGGTSCGPNRRRPGPVPHVQGKPCAGAGAVAGAGEGAGAL